MNEDWDEQQEHSGESAFCRCGARMEIRALLQDRQWELRRVCSAARTHQNEAHDMTTCLDSVSLLPQTQDTILSKHEIGNIVRTTSLEKTLMTCPQCRKVSPMVIWLLDKDEMRYVAICSRCEGVNAMQEVVKST